MLDPIQSAVEKSIRNLAVPTAQQLAQSVQGVVSDKETQLTQAKNPISNLPKTKSPLVIQKEKEAIAQKKISAAKNKSLVEKESATKKIKSIINKFTLPALSAPPKIPSIDKKNIKTKEFLKKIKTVISERRKISVENLQKNKDAFTYPLIINKKDYIPNIPNLPKL